MFVFLEHKSAVKTAKAKKAKGAVTYKLKSVTQKKYRKNFRVARKTGNSPNPPLDISEYSDTINLINDTINDTINLLWQYRQDGADERVD